MICAGAATMRTASRSGIVAALLVACACTRASEPAPRTPGEGLWSDDAAERATAAAELERRGAESIRSLDPSASGCLGDEPRPPRCRNYDRFLEASVEVVRRLVARETAGVHPGARPARDLLWRIVHAADVDPFDLSADPAWVRTDGPALRRRAVDSLDRALDIPETLPESEISRRAVARADRNGRRWYVVAECAGGSMLAGCTYASFVFGPPGERPWYRLVRHDAAESPGAEVRIALRWIGAPAGVGALDARGGFGGDLERVVLYRLGPETRPLCELRTESGRFDLIREVDHLVTIGADGCRAGSLPPGILLTRFTADGSVEPLPKESVPRTPPPPP